MLKKPIVVNLIASPGTGKSTIAAGIFEQLKWNNVNAELVTEFAKDKVWEENPAPFKDGGQLYLLGKQFYRMHRCRDNVDVIVTDSPLCLASYYLRQIKDPQVITDTQSFDNLVKNLIDSFDNMNYFLVRRKKYNPKGRFQTEAESNKIADELWDFFTDSAHGCAYTVDMTKLDGTAETRDLIVKQVLEKLCAPKEVVEKKEPGRIKRAGVEDPQEAISPDWELCFKAKSIPYEQVIRWLRSSEIFPCLKPLSMRITNIILPTEKLEDLFLEAQWPLNHGNALHTRLSRTFNISFSLGKCNQCKTVQDLAEFISSMCKIQH